MNPPGQFKCLAYLLLVTILTKSGFGQHQAFPTSQLKSVQPVPRFTAGIKGSLFGKGAVFIENIGQYGDSFPAAGGMGRIRYGFEGDERPILFTSKGLVILQNVTQKLSHEYKEAMERKGMREEEIEKKKITVDKTLTMEWLDANPNPYIITEGETKAYHTYGSLQRRAHSFKSIVYKDLYPGIDVIYSFDKVDRPGIEYSIVVKPGANLASVKLRIGGDLKTLTQKKNGDLYVSSGIKSLFHSSPVSYYADGKDSGQNVEVRTTVRDNIIRFGAISGYDRRKTLVIDPFISGTSNLTGVLSGIAKDVNFDYAGNVYVAGGGFTNQSELAKYDSAGNLLWTFAGSVPGIGNFGWVFGQLYGGWTVDKNTGKSYLGQGINVNPGALIVRLDANGLYDNYVTQGNPALLEMWKLVWTCNGGKPIILTCGGSTSSNDNFGILDPSSTALTPLNITGIPDDNITGGCCQDISDIAIDPRTNDVYSYFVSIHNANGGTAAVDNHIYKHAYPYTAANITWNVSSGYLVLSEGYNRPYMGGYAPYTTDNSSNTLAVNASFLFYWDGLHLQAYNKTSGAAIGTPVVVSANQALLEGGIYADECNHVFVGCPNGVIKVYLFNGMSFDDTAEPDITLPGLSSNAVYDLRYDNARKLLYACGNGFVSALDISAYCPDQIFTIGINTSCTTGSAKFSVNPAPPTGSTITYTLTLAGRNIGTNTTGQFSSLNIDSLYKLKVAINEGCSGLELDTTFTFPKIDVTAVVLPANCGMATGSLTVTAAKGNAPYTYAMDAGSFQTGNTFSGLTGGVHTVTAKDANGCAGTAKIAITNTGGPVLQFTKTDATCGKGSGTITATAMGGTGAIGFSIDGVNFQPTGNFTGLAGGEYILYAKDGAACINSMPVSIISGGAAPTIFSARTDAICNVQPGTIIAQATGGTTPYQYSLNGGAFQPGPFFQNLAPGNYVLTVKDALGCATAVKDTVHNICIFSVTGVTTAAECNGYNGTMRLSVINGTAPYLYSLDGINYFATNYFFGLPPSPYTVYAKDANGVIATGVVLVGITGCPTLTLTGNGASCGNKNGTITAIAAEGSLPYTYSLDGINFQASNKFTNLAPGPYTVTLKDSVGFYATATYTVNSSCPLVTAVAENATCGKDNGTITATGSNGSAPYTYSIDGINFQTGNSFTNLAPATYIVTVQDALSALNTTSVTITGMSGPSLSPAATPATCKNNDGSITVTGSGGIGQLEYSLDSIQFQNGTLFPGLATGGYRSYVRDATGCTASQNITVPLVNNLTINPGSPDTICEGNSVTLQISSNATQFVWTPAFGISDIAAQNPVANPATTTTYTITAGTGPCTISGTVTIFVRPAPIASAGPDTTVCYAGNAQLHGSGGIKYAWSPAAFLNNAGIANPTANGLGSTTAFALTVTDNFGCSSIIPAQVKVTVTPLAKLFAGNDTSILVNQPLQLNAVDVNNSGFTQYDWTPATGLDNPRIQNPVATIDKDMLYMVQAITANGCQGTDSISIKVFPFSDIFVPTAFTPNGDGKNDVLKAIAIGIKEFRYFTVYNRWGQQIFSTNNPGTGWNGTAKGNLQETGAYVWVAMGVDFHGNSILRKGTVVLIR